MTEPTPLSPAEAADCGTRLAGLLDGLEGVVIGQQKVLHQLLVTLVAGGHALLEGVPGTAKTLSVQVLAEALGCSFKRIQFTPDLMPSDVTGVNVLNQIEQRFEFHPGPLFADLVLGDEINRAPAKTQSALLEAMSEGRTTVDGATHELGDLFTVFATQNPVEYEGTYPLPEAQLDRFLLKVLVGYPDRPAEIDVLRRHRAGFDQREPATFGIGHSLGREGLGELRAAARRVRVEDEVLEYIADLVRSTREDPTLVIGASPRASVALLRAAQACALIDGRDYVIPDDVKSMAVPVLRHRVMLSPEAEIDGASTDERVESAIAQVAAPESRDAELTPQP
ncbi:AAA family ATPase [Engelhardtia mirabilis]|uniref:ATPase family associated with various cellular activities (AAA) n=1 Tax=Engelhardtia mirabilis TaxID=2528011 RepID=A0A518BNN7_9BACT|nr:ATPase family associated with various cellular activities (AAA) [Planctomycetes bacterium Pla133]QDV02916.1 ATPase family associated with various cellular activities (AAA) [Planctomycetes bacterium Pla86]